MRWRGCFLALWFLAIYVEGSRHRNHRLQQRSNDLGSESLPPGGPNVCRSRTKTYCCPGWQRHNLLGLCIIPICSRQCGSGQCVSPNMCLCEGGQKASSCTKSYKQIQEQGFDRKSCRLICMNGGTCVDDKCVCPEGYSGEFCTEPICVESCKNGGQCIGPDRCACFYGFSGNHCEIDYRTGPCYTGYRGNLCVNQLEGVVCTKTLCCATVGKAWGHPCQHCPSRLECDTGYLKNLKTGECVDINECEAIPHLCSGGTCVNSVGSFTCECPSGQTRNPATNRCEDRNECEDENICQDGRCVNTNGGYICLCNPGFIQSQDKTYCIDGRQGICYTLRTPQGRCSNHLHMRLSKKDCCCGVNMGQGWAMYDGDECLVCPKFGEDEHRHLCEAAVSHQIPGSGTFHLTPGTIPSIDQVGQITINECILRPDICGRGKCVDTVQGYECLCEPGFRLGKSHVCEG